MSLGSYKTVLFLWDDDLWAVVSIYNGYVLMRRGADKGVCAGFMKIDCKYLFGTYGRTYQE